MPKKQASGLYRARVRIGVNAEGKAIYKYAAAKTIKGLESEKERIRLEHTGMAPDAQRDILFGAYSQDWFTAQKKGQLSPAGLETYTTAFNKHINPVFGNRQIRAITASQLQAFLNSKAKDGLSASAINKIALAVKQIFRYATATGLIDRDPSTMLKNR